MMDEERQAYEQLEARSKECRERNEAIVNQKIEDCGNDPVALTLLAHVCSIVSDVHADAHARIRERLNEKQC